MGRCCWMEHRQRQHTHKAQLVRSLGWVGRCDKRGLTLARCTAKRIWTVINPRCDPLRPLRQPEVVCRRERRTSGSCLQYLVAELGRTTRGLRTSWRACLGDTRHVHTVVGTAKYGFQRGLPGFQPSIRAALVSDRRSFNALLTRLTPDGRQILRFDSAISYLSYSSAAGLLSEMNTALGSALLQFVGAEAYIDRCTAAQRHRSFLRC
jgi:hypothetical protein